MGSPTTNGVGKRSVLVVEDERNIRRVLVRVFEDEGFIVREVCDARGAYEELRTDSPDIVLLDLKLRDCDGMDVLRRIVAERIPTRVVVISAYATIGIAVESLRLGASDFVCKPFSPDEILVAVMAALGRGTIVEERNGDPEELFDLALARARDGDLAGARNAVRAAIAADPSRPGPYNLFGAIEELNGRWLEGQKFYRVSLDLDAGYAPARANLERSTSSDRMGNVSLGVANHPAGGRDEA